MKNLQDFHHSLWKGAEKKGGTRAVKTQTLRGSTSRRKNQKEVTQKGSQILFYQDNEEREERQR